MLVALVPSYFCNSTGYIFIGLSIFISSVRYEKILLLNHQADESDSWWIFLSSDGSLNVYSIEGVVFLSLILVIDGNGRR